MLGGEGGNCEKKRRKERPTLRVEFDGPAGKRHFCGTVGWGEGGTVSRGKAEEGAIPSLLRGEAAPPRLSGEVVMPGLAFCSTVGAISGRGGGVPLGGRGESDVGGRTLGILQWLGGTLTRAVDQRESASAPGRKQGREVSVGRGEERTK